MSEDRLIITDRDFDRVSALGPGPQLEKELERAVIVSVDRLPEGVVTMHSRGRYLDETTGTRREIQIVFPEQVDLAEGKVSVLAPVGAALLGLSAHQTIEWMFPDGRPHRLRVEKVLFQPESYFLERTTRSWAETSL